MNFKLRIISLSFPILSFEQRYRSSSSVVVRADKGKKKKKRLGTRQPVSISPSPVSSPHDFHSPCTVDNAQECNGLNPLFFFFFFFIILPSDSETQEIDPFLNAKEKEEDGKADRYYREASSSFSVKCSAQSMMTCCPDQLRFSRPQTRNKQPRRKCSAGNSKKELASFSFESVD